MRQDRHLYRKSICLYFRQLCVFVLCIVCCGPYKILGSIPVEQEELEMNLEYGETWYQKAFHILEQKNERTARMKFIIKDWTQQREFGERWNLESTGLYENPTKEQRDWFFKEELLRYFRKEAGRPLKEEGREVRYDLKNWWNEFRSSGDIDSVQSEVVWLEASEKSREQNSGQAAHTIATSSKQKIKVKVRLRPFRGIANLQFENPYVEANAVVGVNGRADIHLGKTFDKLKMRSTLNFQLQEKYTIAVVDKYFGEFAGQGWSGRLLYSDNPNWGEIYEDEVALQVRYHRAF